MSELTCPGCPTFVPLVSKRLADGVAARLKVLGWADPRGALATRLDILGVCLDWLVAPIAGLRMGRGIVGRPYTREEKDAIGAEVHRLEVLPCPFAVGGGCLLGGYCATGQMRQEAKEAQWGWLPSLLAAAIDVQSVKDAVKRGLVADAKIALMTRRWDFPMRSANGLAIASTLPEKQQEAESGLISGAVSPYSH